MDIKVLYGIRVIAAFFNPTPGPAPNIGRGENPLIKPFPMFGKGLVFTRIRCSLQNRCRKTNACLFNDAVGLR